MGDTSQITSSRRCQQSLHSLTKPSGLLGVEKRGGISIPAPVLPFPSIHPRIRTFKTTPSIIPPTGQESKIISGSPSWLEVEVGLKVFSPGSFQPSLCAKEGTVCRN